MSAVLVETPRFPTTLEGGALRPSNDAWVLSHDGQPKASLQTLSAAALHGVMAHVVGHKDGRLQELAPIALDDFLAMEGDRLQENGHDIVFARYQVPRDAGGGSIWVLASPDTSEETTALLQCLVDDYLEGLPALERHTGAVSTLLDTWELAQTSCLPPARKRAPRAA